MFVAPDPNVIIYGSPLGPNGHSGQKGPRGFSITEYRAFIRKGKIDNIFTKIGKKSLEPGYVFAPYITHTTNSIIIEGVDKSYSRKRKIDRLFNLGFEITGSNTFIPKKSLMSRYSVSTISNKYYGSVNISI
jgi:hypothetical protein